MTSPSIRRLACRPYMLPVRGDMYASAWQRIGSGFVPERLLEMVEMGDQGDPLKLSHWQDVTRLVRLGIESNCWLCSPLTPFRQLIFSNFTCPGQRCWINRDHGQRPPSNLTLALIGFTYGH